MKLLNYVLSATTIFVGSSAKKALGHRYQYLSRSVLSALLATLVGFSSPSHALLISLDSNYGSGSLTWDTDTGLEWLDPIRGLCSYTEGGGCGSSFQSYNDILGQLGSGGRYEGFRYATRSDLETLFFSSAGFDPVTSRSGSPTTEDKLAGLYLEQFTDNTFGSSSGGRYTHGYYDDENSDAAIGSAFFTSGIYEWGELAGGSVTFYSAPNPDSKSDPIGHWLVRDSAITVDEPPALSLLAMSLAIGVGLAHRRKGVASRAPRQS